MLQAGIKLQLQQSFPQSVLRSARVNTPAGAASQAINMNAKVRPRPEAEDGHPPPHYNLYSLPFPPDNRQ